MVITKKSLVVAVIVILIALVLVLGFLQYKKHENDYSVVYLATGEVYIGKLTTFPDMQLTDGYVLQITKDPTDPTKSNFQLNPINQALWAPTVMHMNRQNIVFYGPLLSTSKAAETLATKK